MPIQMIPSTPPTTTGAITITSLTMLTIQGVTTARLMPQTPATPQATTTITMATTNIPSKTPTPIPMCINVQRL
ncbi:hypothetical protein M413DRAFT_323859 [Hebeloma cylindrosporum]|uniref:Uncharacterized protein n=1 Tax=Hebeloma cylindrosporum TaxID=76867 RepID=A0A0C2Y4G4_HEBCY|nr:hypothetical protein M413DRAFT_323859 [Hebeloma cylindrosporum h7]